MTIRERIKELCKKNNVSLNQVEIACEFGKGYLSKLDTTTPNMAKIKKIADYFGVSVDYLMTGKENGFSVENAILDAKIAKDMELKTTIEKYYQLNEKEKKAVRDLIELLSNKP